MRKLAIAIAVSLCLPAAAQAATIFGVDENNNLVSFDSANPGTFTSSRLISGTTATFLAIDFRDSNGLLYGLGDDLSLYTINTMSGLASQVGSGPLAISGTNFGFDFNTVADAIRVVSNSDNNYVVNADTGAVTVATPVFYPSGGNPVVTANAYVHGTTTQYAVDTAADTLVTQANSAGTLATVGPLGAAVGPRTSFDIGYDGMGYIQDVYAFHTVDLTTGMASLVGSTPKALFAISAAPTAVPEPATWGMLLLGFGAIGSLVRRRRQNSGGVAHA